MFKYKYSLYIGADNITKEVNIEVINSVLTSAGISGYTLIHTVGLWEGVKEKSVIVTLFSNADHVYMIEVVEKLRRELNQYSIFIEVSDVKLYDVCG